MRDTFFHVFIILQRSHLFNFFSYDTIYVFLVMKMNLKMISAEELNKIENDERYVLVDVRDAKEYEKRHICGAVNIPMNRIRLATFEKDKIIVFYCEHGGNSMIAAREFARRGFQVRTVVGGIKAYSGSFICND